MKTSHRCPKCQHNRILYIACVADRYGDHVTMDQSAPMKIAHYQKSHGTLLGMAMTSSESSGEVEAGVCRSCGYTEFYTKDPASIIVDGVYVRELPPK
jgi:predicted nucleic-acid-binding Zn-ribbon protein